MPSFVGLWLCLAVTRALYSNNWDHSCRVVVIVRMFVLYEKINKAKAASTVSKIRRDIATRFMHVTGATRRDL